MTKIRRKDFQQRSMQARIEYLEEAYRLLLDNLNGIISSRKFMGDPTNIRDPRAIVVAAGAYMKKLFSFKEISFLLVDEADSDFFIAHCVPESERYLIRKEVDSKIENGTFAWALRQNHPVIVPSGRQGFTTILHVLTTQFRTRGMFVGTIETAKLNSTNPLLIMLTAVAKNISYSIESAILYKIIKDKALTLELILKSTGEGIMGVDAEGRVTFANPAVADMTGFGVEELIGEDLHSIFHHTEPHEMFSPQEECALCTTFHSGGVYHTDERAFWKKDGAGFPGEYTSTPIRDEQGKLIGAVVLLRDITERKRTEQEKKRLQEQLLQARKMQAVGQLAGGIAHDFNNILTAIITYGHMLRAKIGDDDALRSYVSQILSSSEKAANLVAGLLAFSRRQTIVPKPDDLNRIVGGLRTLLTGLIREDIKLNTVFTEEELIVMADSNQIEQVLMNLAANAMDAMPGGGTLTIETSVSEADDQFIMVHKRGESDKYAVIIFSDTGEGMSDETKARIFEPFFTTREVGKGTGLGLAMAYGIINQHNGYMNVESELGRGTAFTIYLPLAGPRIAEEDSRVVSAGQRGTETILIAEDNDEARKTAHAILSGEGYRVIEALDGDDAVDKFSQNKDGVCLVIVDIIMPKKNGKQIIEEITRMKPGIKVIFISGYAADSFLGKGLEEEGLDFVPKPFLPDMLLEKVRKVLDGK
jgi:PAS domain S-box-containing protein